MVKDAPPMPRVYSFRELAALFCDLDGRTGSEDIESVTQQVRGAQQRGLLTALDHVGPRGALLIGGKYEPCRARILQILIDLGIQGEALRHLNAGMSAKSTRPLADGTHLYGGFAAAVDGIEKGEAWILRVNVLRDRLEGGTLNFSGKFLRDSEVAAEDPTLPNSTLHFSGMTHFAYTKIPATAVLKPVLDHLASA